MDRINRPALPLPESLSGSVPGSFAHLTVTERMPRIGREVLAESRFPPEIVRRIQRLIEGIPDEPVRSLQDPGAPDLAEWQAYVHPYLGQDWLQVPWFFAEEYFYRRLLEASGYFQSGPTWGLDPFETQKLKVLEAATGAIHQLAAFLGEALVAGQPSVRATEGDLYRLLLNSAWGNQGDLSMWSAHEERPDHGELGVREAHLLVNQAGQAAGHILGSRPALERVDIILDNCGPELVADLGLVDYLLSADLVQSVRLHAKAHPTFVSDALIEDIQATIRRFASLPGRHAAAFAGRLQGQLETRRLQLASDFYWNSPLYFWDMPERIRRELARSGLAISKGDANYRRLAGDRNWPPATPFAQVVGYFPAPLAALRVLKSELALGLPPGRAGALDVEDPGWMVNGNWGVIQFL